MTYYWYGLLALFSHLFVCTCLDSAASPSKACCSHLAPGTHRNHTPPPCTRPLVSRLVNILQDWTVRLRQPLRSDWSSTVNAASTYRVSRTHDNRRRGYCKAGYQQISNVLCLLASRTNPKMCKNDASSYYSNIALLIRISTAPKNGAFLPSCSVRSTPHAVHQYTPVGGTVPNTLIYK